MILWVDDLRQPPSGDYMWVRSVNEAKRAMDNYYFDYIDLDHDAGDFAYDGGDYIKLLDWLEGNGQDVIVKLHTMNPVGRQNMRAIIQKNGWREIF